MTGYYDVVLGIIPLSLVGLTALLLLFTQMSLSVAIPLASVVTIGVMGHAMFVRGPTQVGAEAKPETQSGSSKFRTAD